jgi:hypothetical protein
MLLVDNPTRYAAYLIAFAIRDTAWLYARRRV